MLIKINLPLNTPTIKPQDLKHLKCDFYFLLLIMNSSPHQLLSGWNQYGHTFFSSQDSHLPGFGCSGGSAGGSRRAGCQPMERMYAWVARHVSWATQAVPAPRGSGWWRSCDWAATGSWLVYCPPAGRHRHASGNTQVKQPDESALTFTWQTVTAKRIWTCFGVTVWD